MKNRRIIKSRSKIGYNTAPMAKPEVTMSIDSPKNEQETTQEQVKKSKETPKEEFLVTGERTNLNSNKQKPQSVLEIFDTNIEQLAEVEDGLTGYEINIKLPSSTHILRDSPYDTKEDHEYFTVTLLSFKTPINNFNDIQSAICWANATIKFVENDLDNFGFSSQVVDEEHIKIEFSVSVMDPYDNINDALSEVLCFDTQIKKFIASHKQIKNISLDFMVENLNA